MGWVGHNLLEISENGMLQHCSSTLEVLLCCDPRYTCTVDRHKPASLSVIFTVPRTNLQHGKYMPF
jgi:hypothetical protein